MEKEGKFKIEVSPSMVFSVAVILLGLIIFGVVLFVRLDKQQNINNSLMDSNFKLQSQIDSLNLSVENCQYINSQVSNEKSEYEFRLRKCEREKKFLLTDDCSIYHTSVPSDSIGEFLSRLGYAQTLSDAERLFLPK